MSDAVDTKEEEVADDDESNNVGTEVPVKIQLKLIHLHQLHYLLRPMIHLNWLQNLLRQTMIQLLMSNQKHQIQTKVAEVKQLHKILSFHNINFHVMTKADCLFKGILSWSEFFSKLKDFAPSELTPFLIFFTNPQKCPKKMLKIWNWSKISVITTQILRHQA